VDTPSEDALFGPWLRRRRKVLDLTQKELARRVGCSPATIRKVEADDRHPSRHLARVLAGVLGVPEPELEAFVRFARGGWADRPPTSAVPDFDRPWLVGAASSSGGAMSGEVPLAAVEPANGTPEDEAEHVPEAPRIVAREHELERLDRELEHALAGNGRVVLVSGEPGQGKTALMTAFAARAQAAYPELLVAVGTCNAYTGRGDPFLPFRQILAQLTGEVPSGSHLDAFQRERAVRLTRAVPRAADILVRKGPHLLDRLVPLAALGDRMQQGGYVLPPLPATGGSLPGGVGRLPSGGEDQRALRSETAATLAALAEGAPLLLMLDDLHWLDDSSAELLLYLASVAPDHRMVVLGAFRPADLPSPGSGGAHLSHPLIELAQSGATTIDVGLGDGRAFVDAWLDGEANALDEDFRAALLGQTGGHPLFTIELLRAMQERGDLVKDEAGRWSAAPDLHWEQVPDRIADALAARVGRLDGAARDVLRVASVEGEVFTAEVAARLLGLEPRQAVASLGSVLDRGHRLVAAVDVQRVAGGLVSRYAFRHNLIQRYVYESIDEGERSYLHEAVAVALEALLGGDADPVALAQHFTLAHAPDRAAVHHRRAGDQARKAAAFDRAIEHYQAALASWDSNDPAGRATLLRDLGESHWISGHLDDARLNLGEALAGFRASGDMREAGAAQLVIARTHFENGNWQRSFETCREALALLEQGPETPELAWAQSSLAQLHWVAMDDAEGLTWGRRALETAERVGADYVRADALDTVGGLLVESGRSRSEEGLRMLSESYELADRLDLPYEACRAGHNHGEALRHLGRFDEAKERWEGVLGYARDHQVALYEGVALHELWRLAWRQGRWSFCFSERPQLERRANGEGPFRTPLFPVVSVLASADVDLGQASQARSALQRSEPVLRRLVEPVWRAPYLRERLRLAVMSGQPEAADAFVLDIAETVRGKRYAGAVVPPVLTGLQWMVRRPSGKLRATAQECLEGLEQKEAKLHTSEACAAAAEARGTFAAVEGDPEAAATHLMDAAEHWQACGFPLDEARARGAAARELARSGKDSEAVGELERSRVLLDRLAAQLPTEVLRVSFASVAEAMRTGSAT